MEIQQFVSGVLTPLENGLANATLQNKSYKFMFGGTINFDIAVKYTKSKEGETKVSIGNNITVADTRPDNNNIVGRNEVVSRVQFSVRLDSKERQSGVVQPQSYRFSNS